MGKLGWLLPEAARSIDSATPQLLTRARRSRSYPALGKVSSRPRPRPRGVRDSPASATCRTQQLYPTGGRGCLYSAGDRGLPASASRLIASRSGSVAGPGGQKQGGGRRARGMCPLRGCDPDSDSIGQGHCAGAVETANWTPLLWFLRKSCDARSPCPHLVNNSSSQSLVAAVHHLGWRNDPMAGLVDQIRSLRMFASVW